jgi:hypothetical protein
MTINMISLKQVARSIAIGSAIVSLAYPVNAQSTIRSKKLIAGEINSSLSLNQFRRSSKPNQANQGKYSPLFKGALDLAKTRQFTISVPIGNGQRQDVPIRVTESGQLIDPLTNQVAVPIDPSKAKTTKGGRIAEEVQKKVVENIQRKAKERGRNKKEGIGTRGSSELDRLSYTIDALNKYGKIQDIVDIIESSSIKEGVVKAGVAGGVIPKLFDPVDIASGFITGDFPSYLDDLDGLGTLAIWNYVNKAFKDAVDGQNTGETNSSSQQSNLKQMFSGTWEAQIPGNKYQMKVHYNFNANQYEGLLSKQGQASQQAGFSIDELVWKATLSNNPNGATVLLEQAKWRSRNGVQWRQGSIDLRNSNANKLVTSTAIFHRVN